MFGHRPDGKRVSKLDPIVQMTPYLMPMRCDAQVFLEHKADYEKMARYIAEKGREGEKITFMQIVAAAYVRSVSQLPELNRYIYNKQYYARDNCSISYVVLNVLTGKAKKVSPLMYVLAALFVLKYIFL